MVRMRVRSVVLVVVATLVVAGVGAGFFWWQSEQSKDREASSALTALAEAVPGGGLEDSGLAFEDPSAATASDAIATQVSDIVTGASIGDVARAGDHATATMQVTWRVGDNDPVDGDVPVGATLTDGTWVIDAPHKGTYLSAQVEPDETVSVTKTWSARGDLLDRDGDPLMPTGTVYPVQLDPVRADDATARELEQVVDEPAGSLVKKLDAAHDSGSKAPIPVITYRESDFLERRDALDALTGVIYPKTEQPLGRTRTFGQPLLGSFGDVTAEIVDGSDGRYAAGDRAGTSGLQRQYDTRLAGDPGVTVETSSGTVLFRQDPVEGSDVKLTLDADVQGAAEGALGGAGGVPSALVAVDVPSGDVIASANSPELGFDRALTGQFPPGSTFKVATSYALLGNGQVTPSTPVSCPQSTVVDGMRVRNFEGETLGSPTFRDDFVHSCNTAFVQVASSLGNGELSRAADALGVGAGWGDALGVEGVFDGSVPRNNGATDKAAASIGQGRDLVSPVSLAVMTASVARGSYVQPALVVDPEPSGVDRSPQQLDGKVVRQLRDFMRGVVTEGTATVMQGTPGGAVHGKTGTAEFGSGDPPKTHAWFVGWQGDVAFAVLVEEGRSGGSVAAPIAKDFLGRLAEG
jgi:cell division protein FtsI/penicillin-binding protein 2